MKQGYFCRPKADNLIQVTYMALNKHSIKPLTLFSKKGKAREKSCQHITAMNPLTWFQSATPCSTSHPCPAPRIVGAEYVLCCYVITITASYTLHNFLAAVLTIVHGSGHLYQTQRHGNLCCTPCIQTQYEPRKVLNRYDSTHYR
jgi:hypothetical protein